MIRFYAPDIATTPVLPEADSRHCVQVLRMQPGQEVEVTDGKGFIYRCRLLEAHRKRARLEIIEAIDTALPWRNNITVAVAPTKHLDRMEWLVEKLTEVGINRFVPLLCRHNERRDLKVERLEKIAVSAMKQSLKATLPEICPLTPIEQFVANCNASQRFVAHCDASLPRLSLPCEYSPNTDVAIMIGPEGDFAPFEIEATLHAGFQAVTLGDTRLRTETAALWAVTACHVLNQASLKQ